MNWTWTILQQAIAEWLNRADLTGVIPTFIGLAEVRFAREIRVQAMMRRARYRGIGSQYAPLPIQYLEMRRLSLIDSSGALNDLRQVTPESFREKSNGGYPDTYCVHREIEFDAPLPDTGTDFAVEMVYYRSFDPISFQNPTNWLLTQASDVYLYGSLVAAEPYLRNDERIPVWGEGYAAAVKGLLRSNYQGKVNSGGQRLSMVGGGMTP